MVENTLETAQPNPEPARVEPPMFRSRPNYSPSQFGQAANNYPSDSASNSNESWLLAAANEPSHSGESNETGRAPSPELSNGFLNGLQTERRAFAPPSARTIGNVVSCNGSKVIIAAEANNISLQQSDTWTVGQIISIKSKHGRVVAMVREMATDNAIWDNDGVNRVSVQADLLGEVYENSAGQVTFKRGVSQYPGVGSIAHKIRVSDLECIYDLGSRKGIMVGELSQSADIPAMVGVDDLLRRHVAIVGTTGVGKSCAVSLLVLKVMAADENLRVVMLDPHNEFASAFGDKAHCLDQNNLDLPFWLLNFDELEDVIFRGRPIPEESDILRELVVAAKMEKTISPTDSLRRPDNLSINVDTPVPFRITEVLKQIDEILGHLEPKFSRSALRSLKMRIEIIENNPRYAFMFGRGGREDNFEAVIANIFRLPANGKPMTTINLSGLPSEVVNSVASVIARLSFEVARASLGAIKVLLVCEEAHRYVPSDISLGFMPTRRAISRIAKEGRKYGCAIAVVTQRPGELDPTILSQCSTVFAMRLTNESDQEIIRSALSDSSGSVISFLPSLDNREAIAFGEGVSVPMRLRFADNDLSKTKKSAGDLGENIRNADDVKIRLLVQSMRGIETHQSVIPPVMPTNSPNIRAGLLRPGVSLSETVNKPDADQADPKTGLRGRNW